MQPGRKVEVSILANGTKRQLKTVLSPVQKWDRWEGKTEKMTHLFGESLLVGVSEQRVNLFFQSLPQYGHISFLCFKERQTGLERKGVRRLVPAVKKKKKTYAQCKSRSDYCKPLNKGSEHARAFYLRG